MNIRFNTLTLQCRKSREVINFSPQVTFFHGPISTGKSSIARLIDFCLGGTLEKTPALAQELVQVQLSASIGDNEVLFERDANRSKRIQVTWSDRKGTSESIRVPIAATREPIWGEDVHNLSDLIFRLLGLSPIRIPSSSRYTESKLVRLSFRDILWYCYLEQEKLDSSFFRLEQPIVQRKSRYVMRYIVGDYTKRLNELEVELSNASEQQKVKKEEASRLRSFLDQFGYGSEEEIDSEIDTARENLKVAEKELSEKRKEYAKDTHLSDDLRNDLMQLGKQLLREEQILSDLNERIEDQDSLKAELVEAKLKMARSRSARSVFTGVLFEHCPACGERVTAERKDEDICHLCGRRRGEISEEAKEDVSEQDLIDDESINLRIEELDESIERHIRARKLQEQRITYLTEKKASLDNKLVETLEVYESKFLAKASELGREAATSEERLRILQRVLKMPKAVAGLEEQVDNLSANTERLKREILREREVIKEADRYIHEIEETFVQSLLAVNFPGISGRDKVRIDRRKWVPVIIPYESDEARWDFFNAGSAGKKTLLNVCYALSVHIVSTKHNLPLPTFLIIDTPMKNIDEEVNQEVFMAFYNYLYRLAKGPLRKTQFIIIDKQYFPHKEGEIEMLERFMTTKDKDFPPLIPYYSGH